MAKRKSQTSRPGLAKPARRLPAKQARQPRAPRRRRPGLVKQAGRKPTPIAPGSGLSVVEVEQLEDLRKELERSAAQASPMRWNANPEDVQRSIAQLVLTLVEFIRQLLERQAIRRMEAGTLTDQQTDDVGRALMKLEETIGDLADKLGIAREDLNLDLGPIGKLL
jgi:hypothetical protein